MAPHHSLLVALLADVCVLYIPTYLCCCQIEEAKHEVRELVEFLKNPAHFQRLGAKLPKGGASHNSYTHVPHHNVHQTFVWYVLRGTVVYIRAYTSGPHLPLTSPRT